MAGGATPQLGGDAVPAPGRHVWVPPQVWYACHGDHISTPEHAALPPLQPVYCLRTSALAPAHWYSVLSTVVPHFAPAAAQSPVAVQHVVFGYCSTQYSAAPREQIVIPL